VGTRQCAGFAAVLLTAAALSACGSSGTDSTDSTTREAVEPRPEADAKPEGEDGTTAKQSQPEGNSSPGQRGGESEQPSGGSDAVTPLQVSGGGSGHLRSKGGDNSIQDYGDEAGESELQEVAEIVHDFYVARVEQQWDKACEYLSKENIKQLEQLAARSKQQDVDCGTVLEAFTRTLPASVKREITTVDARSFRHNSSQGFLIYYGAGKVLYAMPMRPEDGTWKVTALVGTTLG
jgi:hypothetical protein